MPSRCPRCGTVLFSDGGASPAFCAHCGLAQLRVSEDALVSAHAGSDEVQSAGPVPHDGALSMPRALRVVALAGVAGTLVALLPRGALISGGSGGVVLLLTPLLTVGSVHMYSRGRPPAMLSPAGGTRLGALLGLWMGSLIAASTGIAGFVLRYGYHSHAMDARIQQAAAQMPLQLRSAGPVPPDLLLFLQTPEFMAGTFIFGHVFTLLLLVAAGSVCGWISATLLRARQQRSIG